MSNESAGQPTNRVHRKPYGDRSQLLLVTVAVVAVAALGLAVWALLRTTDSTTAADTHSYTDTQRADSKTKICGVFGTVRTGVAQNTHQQPSPADPVTGAMAVAANARLSLYDGGQYLLARLDPATPPDLADAVRKFANGLMDIGAAETAGTLNNDPAQAARLSDAENEDTAITQLCS